MSNPRLKRARAFSQAMSCVNSTVCRLVKVAPTLARRSSSTVAGVTVKASAYSMTNFSVSVRLSDSRQLATASMVS